MIRIAVQTGGPQSRFSMDETYRKIRDWGFDAVDANVDMLLPGSEIKSGNIPELLVRGGKDCMELFRPWAEASKKYSLDNYQAHAPFPSYVFPEDGDTSVNTRMIEVLKNTIRGCDVMNCRNLVIHPFFPGYSHWLTPGEEWELNMNNYAKLIPTAKEYGVTINLENMFVTYNGMRYAACCSDIALACKYVDELNTLAGEKCFGFCLDTGHLLLSRIDVKNAMITLGSRITAFHVNDNDGIIDGHTAPYTGLLDWDRFVEGLKAIRYDKTMSFETFNVWNKALPETMDDMMRFIAKTGRTFAEKAKF